MEICKKLKSSEGKVYPGGYIASAFGFLLHQWDKLTVCLNERIIRIDNNDADSVIKPFVIGKKVG